LDDAVLNGAWERTLDLVGYGPGSTDPVERRTLADLIGEDTDHGLALVHALVAAGVLDSFVDDTVLPEPVISRAWRLAQENSGSR
jgi:hypothetical protein